MSQVALRADRAQMASRARSRLWVPALVAVAVVLMFVGTAGWWPWDHDEVLSFAELGVIPIDRYPGPLAQLERMHRVLPVWNALQNAVLRLVPPTEWGARLFPSSCGALAVIAAFLAARRWRGEWFAWSLLVLTGGSQSLLWLSQQNRFYPVALLWLTLAFIVAWSRSNSRWTIPLTVVLTAAAVLSHSLTVVVFGLGGVAALVGLPFAWLTRATATRLIAAGATAGAIYVFYSRPALAGWVSGNTGGTNPLVSFVAQIGIPVLALALVGAVSALVAEDGRRIRWWVGLAALGLIFVGSAPTLLSNWNPRYAVFFMPAIWVVAAHGVTTITEGLAGVPLRLAWIACVACLLAPKLLSHFIDGSRHDFRSAALVVERDRDLSRQPVYSNWPETLQYYLQPITGQPVREWRAASAPSGSYFVVIASNAWDPILQIAGKRTEVVSTIARRRFDEQSHVVRVYRVTDLR
ncbi:MAG TPA: hypothetical protein VEL02_09075 [Jatrophihabitantaceae bacterium]|nr:hypothetical protein [Jatrophihabitantaceae bacterium]